jgi:hypothetical protein
LKTEVALNVSSLIILHLCIREVVKALLHNLITAISQSSLLIILNSEIQHVIWHVQGASWETDVFEMDVTEQVEGVEAWVGVV